MTTQSGSWGLHWRSKPSFIRATVTIYLFTDLFLYSLVVPVLPFLLRDRFSIPEDQVQPYVSELLAVYSAASVLFSIPAGWIADKSGSRKKPLLAGLVLLVIGSALFAVGQRFVILLIARCLQGMAAAVVWTVGLAMIQDSVSPGNMGRAVGTVCSPLLLPQLAV